MHQPGRITAALAVLTACLLAVSPDSAAGGERGKRGGHVDAGRAPWHEFDRCDPLARTALESRRGFGPLWLALAEHPGLRFRRGRLPRRAKRFAAADCIAVPVDTQLLVDGSGRTVAQVGRFEVGSVAVRVPLQHTFAEPVVLLGPPTARDPEPGVLRAFDVGADGFRARFEEWPYLDGVHAREQVSFVVVERGIHRMLDGSVWEADGIEADGDGFWSEALFATPSEQRPHLFLSLQSRHEPEAAVARANDVSAERGFLVALFEEEASRGGHAPERVGYLAVFAPDAGGRALTHTDSVPYLVRSLTADHLATPILTSTLHLQEEGSVDDEASHADETVDFLALGSHVFAQDVSASDLDTASLRHKGPDAQSGLAWGTVPDLTDAWQTVPFARSYENPVVVVRPLSRRGADPSLARIQNVGGDGFEVRVGEWAYLDGRHTARERAFYLVAEMGIQEVGGLVVQAATHDTATLARDGFDTVPFFAPFDSVPGVFSAVMTHNGSEPVTVRMNGRGADSVGLALQEEEILNDGHELETLGWIAIEQGRGTTADGRALAVFDAAANHEWTDVGFGEPFGGRFPFVAGQVASYVGADPVELHFVDVDPDGISIALTEEQSSDPETNHAFEDVTLFVAD